MLPWKPHYPITSPKEGLELRHDDPCRLFWSVNICLALFYSISPAKPLQAIFQHCDLLLLCRRVSASLVNKGWYGHINAFLEWMKPDYFHQNVGRREKEAERHHVRLHCRAVAGLKASSARVWTQCICFSSVLLQRVADENKELRKLNFGPGDSASSCHSKANQMKT